MESLKNYNDPVFDKDRKIIRFISFFLCIVIGALLVLTNLYHFNIPFFLYSNDELKFLYLITFVIFFSCIGYVLISKLQNKQYSIRSFYLQRLNNLKDSKAITNAWDAAGTSLGYGYKKILLALNILFLSVPLIVAFTFNPETFSTFMFCLLLVSLFELMLVPSILAAWIIILRKDLI